MAIVDDRTGEPSEKVVKLLEQVGDVARFFAPGGLAFPLDSGRRQQHALRRESGS